MTLYGKCRVGAAIVDVGFIGNRCQRFVFENEWLEIVVEKGPCRFLETKEGRNGTVIKGSNSVAGGIRAGVRGR